MMDAAEEKQAAEPRQRPGGPCIRFSPSGNRAVSELFRVFGGATREREADGSEKTSGTAMHAGERLLIGLAATATLFAAVSEGLVAGLGPVAGWLLVIPVGFVVLNLFALFLPGRRPRVQWWIWLVLLTAWGWWRKDAGGYVSVFAWTWIGIFCVNAIALLILGVGKTMEWSGWPGAAWRLSLFALLHVMAFVDHWFWGWAWAIAGGFSISVLCCLAILRPGSQWLGPVTVKSDGPQAVITIDDGPDPVDTPRLLDILDRRGVKAIFFVIGEKVKRHPELAREIVRRGHELGNHTLTHPQAMFWCAGPWRTLREISGCQSVIEEVTGVRPRYFRAPVGHRNLFTHPFTRKLGLEIMAWSRRGFDAVEKDPGVVLRKMRPVSSGDIVLMHEATPIAAEVLEGILEEPVFRS